MTVSELRKVCEGIKNLFNECSFGSSYATTFLDFMDTTIGGKPTQTHLDDIFDLIVKDSSFLNAPENKKYLFTEMKKRMPDEKLHILNNYRKKFGMPEV